MKKTSFLFLAVVLFVSSAGQADEADPQAFCSSCGSTFSSLVNSALAVVGAISEKAIPNCQEVQIAKTCTATFYGKGDGFSSGTTACGNTFNPLLENTVAIKTAKNGGFFSRSLCGKKAFITTKDPISGMTKTVEVRITDSGSMGGKTSRRCMDLSYRAAHQLGIIKRGVASNTTIKVCK